MEQMLEGMIAQDDLAPGVKVYESYNVLLHNTTFVVNHKRVSRVSRLVRTQLWYWQYLYNLYNSRRFIQFTRCDSDMLNTAMYRDIMSL